MLANGLILLLALEHIWFLILEMFLWTQPVGLKTFRQTLAAAKTSAVLAANQGLYNGFLSAGLLWSVAQPDVSFAFQLKVFFLGCVLTAGLYGAYSVSRRILFIQALPAALALAVVMFAH